MPSGSGSSAAFVEIPEETLDANDSTSASAVLDVSETPNVSFQAINGTGAHTTHVTILQCSLDGVGDRWWPMPGAEIAAGASAPVWQGLVHTKFVRAKIGTVEGSPSTVKVIIQAK